MRIKIFYKDKYDYDIVNGDSIVCNEVVEFVKEKSKTKEVTNIMAMSDYKNCPKCNTDYHKDTLDDKFYIMKSGIDGYMNICKECYNAKRRSKSKDESGASIVKTRAEIYKAWYDNNKDELAKRRKIKRDALRNQKK